MDNKHWTNIGSINVRYT